MSELFTCMHIATVQFKGNLTHVLRSENHGSTYIMYYKWVWCSQRSSTQGNEPVVEQNTWLTPMTDITWLTTVHMYTRLSFLGTIALLLFLRVQCMFVTSWCSTIEKPGAACTVNCYSVYWVSIATHTLLNILFELPLYSSTYFSDITLILKVV